MGCNSSSQSKSVDPNSPLSRGSKNHRGASLINKYALLISICQGRNVKKSDVLSQSDPYVLVRCNGEVRQTKVVKNRAEPVWNDTISFYFEQKPSEIEFTLMDKDTLTKDDFIGKHVMHFPEGKWDDEGEFLWIDCEGTNDAGPVCNGQVQVRVKRVILNHEQLNEWAHYNFTHIMAINVHRAHDLVKKDVLSKNDSYAKVSWARKQYRTKTVQGSNPEWDSTVYCWVNAASQKTYKVAVSVFDQDDGKDDEVGTGYISIADLFDNVDDEPVERSIPLTCRAKTDKDLQRLLTSETEDEASKQNFGVVDVSLKLISKEAVLKSFWHDLVSEFDVDHEGSLSREEVWAMLETLQANLSADAFETFWNAADKDGSDSITVDEGEDLLNALVFASPASANGLLHFLVGGKQALSESLMSGVTELDESSRKETLRVFDRMNGVIVDENIPRYILVALKTLYSSKASRFVSGSKRARKIMHKMTVKQGEKMNDPKSVKDIMPFVKLHNLNLAEVEKPVDDYKNFNQFFYRKLKPEARPVASPEDSSIAVSPADCRMMVFPDINQATELWIKGDQFTVENLLGPGKDHLVQKYKNGSLVIARLAPQDYHRWHWPVSGRTAPARTKIPGAYVTVNPIAVNNNVNVYTENIREICELDSPDFGTVTLVCIGATMVGSINIVTPDDSDVSKGDTHGYFAFGGSTVLVLFEKDRIEFDGDLLANSSKTLETLVQVNTRIGVRK